jgi:hypothetical protein
MRTGRQAMLTIAVTLAACGPRATDSPRSQPLTARREAAIEVDVRGFAEDVARDITAQGPAAWRRYFSESPAFFMAADGSLQFPDSASATAGIQALARTIQHIDLKWDSNLRVDPLAPDLALIATPYHELIVTSSGSRVDSSGFFTGITEFRDGRWRFRNAHWSSARQPAPPSP